MKVLRKLQRLKKYTIEEKVISEVTIESFLEIFDNFLVIKKQEGCANATIQGYRDNMDKCFCKFLQVEQIDKTTILDIGIKLKKGVIAKDSHHSPNIIRF